MKIELISGLNRKAPAAILLHTENLRILLDAGGALEPDEALWPVPANIDAVLLSHDHIDHIGGLHRIPRNVPVYCSHITAQSLPAGYDIHCIEIRGRFRIGGITITTGSSGHAYGGVWFHLDIAGGIFYSGDISMESMLFHFDPPPPARIALVDASYGFYDTPQPQQLDKLRQHLQQPCLCPVPPSGRAVEMALLMAPEKQASIVMDEPCRLMMQQMAQQNDGSLRPGVPEALRSLVQNLPLFSTDASLLLVSDPDGMNGMAGVLRARHDFHHRTLFTGHLNQLAYQQLLDGEVDFCRWNVHPTLSCLKKLVSLLSCDYFAPLFTALDNTARWQQVLRCEIITLPTVERELCQ
ncbi:MBL fold metallo-hydrolase [Citrobacter sp. JGM124]|uniref:MBL fold metallo-hydrolase n=1 Tax=Citrobacter sp. JGM124 TaxID=2799789 RepID=UPI001BA89491|nr:MBL fold metallo-hydrolase [Citrobacter sp. JGM124]MBS0848781.1 MBL fold metallo-hydrolase [Citrobacter sp. JGM124]